MVNAGGAWVDEIIRDRSQSNSPTHIRLVRGSHVVVRRIFEHNRAYIFQNEDERVLFAIPYEEDFTLIGTTDVDNEGSPAAPQCSANEAAYLVDAASRYLSNPISLDDIVWTYAGVRPLHDDAASSASVATRDYVLHVEDVDGLVPLLNVFGGKITTYRSLAESALAKLTTYFPTMGPPWTADAALPGGALPVDGVAALVADEIMPKVNEGL